MRRLDTIVLIIFVSLLSVGIALAQNAISPNETLTGSLSDTETKQEYTFAGKSGDSISIYLTSRMFDTFLEIVNSEGTTIVSNDDSGGSLNSTIENFNLPDDGDYTIVVTSASGNDTGDYELRLTQWEVGVLEYGSIVEGQVAPDAPVVNYEFEGEAGDIILISMSSETFDTFLHLRDSDFYGLVSDDDGGNNTNSIIVGYTLPETATYIIDARGYTQEASGTFTLQLFKIDVTPLESQTATSAQLDNDIHVYSFEAQIGDIISLDVVGESDLDTMITLRNPAGYVLTTDDDSGDDWNPEIHDYFIDEGGTYIVIVQGVGAATGTYAITLAITEPELLLCREALPFSFSPKSNNYSFQIEATDDTDYALVSIGGETVHNLYIRVVQSNNVIPFDESQPSLFDYDLTPLRLSEADYVLYSFSIDNADEPVRILVSDYNYTTQAFTLELVCQ